MSAPATLPAQYTIFKIVSQDSQNSIDLNMGQFRVTGIDFFENILSPHVHGGAVITSSSGAVEDEKLGRLTGISDILTVGAQLLIRIEPQLGKVIDYARGIDDYKVLYVTKVSRPIRTSTSETIAVQFHTKIGFLNLTRKVTQRFNGPISASAKKIIEQYLELSDDQVEVTQTGNSQSFEGLSRRPLDILIDLAVNSIPESTSNPGYVCFESIGKFNFVSLDKLTTQDSEFTYTYSGVMEATEELQNESNNFKISKFSVKKDQDLLSQLRTGVYASKSFFLNTFTYEFTEIDMSVNQGKLLKDPKVKTGLGDFAEIPEVVSKSFTKDSVHRINTTIIDFGAEKGKIELDDKNNNPELYISAASMRYNILFSQKVSITIPCNTDLHAGSTIKLILEDISDQKEKGVNQRQSGRYIIQALRHHFNGNSSFTFLDLIRDSYGLHFTKAS